jgi:pimeloyl-ACP methyl ester carboxylesterase
MTTTTTTKTTTSRFAELAGDLRPGVDDHRAPLVFLHGLTFDRSMWAPALAELERLDPGRRTLTLDLPGHGESSEAFRGLDAVVAQIGEAVAAAGIATPVYVGHSIGIMPAMLLATADGSRGVVNVDAALNIEGLATFLASRSAELHGDRYRTVWNQLLEGLIPANLPRAAEQLVRDTSHPRQAVMLGYWEPIFRDGARAQSDQVLVGIGAMRGLRIPYLIVAGEEIDDGYREFLRRNFPEAAATSLPGSGHFPHLAHPTEFAELLAMTS